MVKNISSVLLREKDPSNKDISPKICAIFTIDKSSTLKSNYIDVLRSLLGDQLNKPNFNELYIKKK